MDASSCVLTPIRLRGAKQLCKYYTIILSLVFSPRSAFRVLTPTEEKKYLKLYSVFAVFMCFFPIIVRALSADQLQRQELDHAAVGAAVSLPLMYKKAR